MCRLESGSTFTMQTKVCKTCGFQLPLTSFTPHKRYTMGTLPHCKPCMNSKRKSRAGNEKSIAYSKWYRETYPEKVAASRASRVDDWWIRNRGRHNEKNRKWSARNPAYNRAKAAKRRAYRLKATPKWLTGIHWEEIKNFYWLSKDLERVSGEKYHVDHIVPLQGKNVCGLHVPWNLQILPSDINLSKHNKH